jgi:hypothetical protein
LIPGLLWVDRTIALSRTIGTIIIAVNVAVACRVATTHVSARAGLGTSTACTSSCRSTGGRAATSTATTTTGP